MDFRSGSNITAFRRRFTVFYTGLKINRINKVIYLFVCLLMCSLFNDSASHPATYVGWQEATNWKEGMVVAQFKIPPHHLPEGSTETVVTVVMLDIDVRGDTTWSKLAQFARRWYKTELK
jgi:hypothetical protein